MNRHPGWVQATPAAQTAHYEARIIVEDGKIANAIDPDARIKPTAQKATMSGFLTELATWKNMADWTSRDDTK